MHTHMHKHTHAHTEKRVTIINGKGYRFEREQETYMDGGKRNGKLNRTIKSGNLKYVILMHLGKISLCSL